ncbi:MAG: dihydrofolate reductase [Candidatus Omnitrophica bacterium]|nr:dihydrofolate reductase [Candidatus Omnitrophota bacterium]
MKKDCAIIVAIDKKRGIGRNGSIPWTLSEDMRHFKDITTKARGKGQRNVVIMGRKTWESIPEKFRPLKDRINIVLTKMPDFELPLGVIKAQSLADAFNSIKKIKDVKIYRTFIIGGGEVYNEAINIPEVSRLYITHVDKEFECDVFFPSFEKQFNKYFSAPVKVENGLKYYFCEYRRMKKAS